MRKYWILSIGLILLILATGCTSTTTSSSSTTPTPQIVYVTVTVTQTAATIAPQASVHLTGNSDDVQSFTATGSGLRIFTMKYTGEGNFAVILQNSEGKTIELLANEIGSYTGKSSESLVSGTYYLKVKASGPWTIDISSP